MTDSDSANDVAKHGVKRKRAHITQDTVDLSQDAVSPVSAGGPSEVQRHHLDVMQGTESHFKLAGKLHHDIREVRKAVKKAKSFETQRLIKHIKSLRLGKSRGNTTIDDLDAQLKIIKEVDPGYVSTTALARKICKDRSLSGHGPLRDVLKLEMEASGGYPHAPIADSLEAKVLHRLLSSRVLAQAMNDVVEDLRRVMLGDSWVPKAKCGGQGPSDHDSPVHPAKRGKIDTGKKDDIDEEDFDEPDNEEDDSKNSDRGCDTPVHAASSTDSTFLPSLLVNFIPGDSADSDWSDREANIADGSKKKNRRGQRARRAIWEKKYGQNANHKKRERATAEAVAKKMRRSQVASQRQYRSQEQSSRSEAKTGAISKERNTQLHPSWEAKKRLKERELAVKGLGTKIRF